jgi:phage shock protein PspC (stress-responsive transcriptional regulator)
MEKKLYRSKSDKKIAGVCAGLAKYLNIDVTLIRLIWALVVICGGAGLLAYLVCALVIPEEPNAIEG